MFNHCTLYIPLTLIDNKKPAGYIETLEKCWEYVTILSLYQIFRQLEISPKKFATEMFSLAK